MNSLQSSLKFLTLQLITLSPNSFRVKNVSGSLFKCINNSNQIPWQQINENYRFMQLYDVNSSFFFGGGGKKKIGNQKASFSFPIRYFQPKSPPPPKSANKPLKYKTFENKMFTGWGRLCTLYTPIEII